jgi:hypothetical protein
LTGIETSPNEIVREAIERAELGMADTYSIVALARISFGTPLGEGRPGCSLGSGSLRSGLGSSPGGKFPGCG